MSLTPPPCLFTSRDRDVTSGSGNRTLTTTYYAVSFVVIQKISSGNSNYSYVRHFNCRISSLEAAICFQLTLNYIKLHTVNFCCINRYNVRYFTLVLGTINLTIHDNGYVLQTSSDSVVHDGYNSVTINNDIALIKLPRPVEFSRKYLYVLHTVYKLQRLE